MRLVDHFIEVLAYTSFLVQHPNDKNLPYEDGLERINQLINDAQKSCKLAGHSDREFTLALFAICAWVDETILASSWPGKEKWLFSLLQRRYFNTSNAGKEFFENFTTLTRDEKELSEVYGYCLALGFKGQYFRPADKGVLDAMIADTVKAITNIQDLSFPQKLIPEAYPPTPTTRIRPRKRWDFTAVTWLVLIVPFATFILLFLIYSSSLHNALLK